MSDGSAAADSGPYVTRPTVTLTCWHFRSVFFEAKWFLKAYWSSDLISTSGKNYGKISENLDIAEHVFNAAKDMKRRAGSGEHELDQLQAHHFLEKMGEAITYTKFKKKFAELDLDFNNKLSLTEYLVHHYDTATKDDLSHIEKMVNKKMVEVKGLAAAEAAMAEAQADVEEAQKAQAEVQEIMQLINKKKMNHALKADKLAAKIEKATSAVKKGIHQTKHREHMNNHPIDNKTELTQKAAVRRQKKATRMAKAALKEAEEEVEKLKNSGVQAGATLWWMERNLKEMEKTMSKKAFAKKMAKIQKKKEAAEADDAALAALGK